MQQLEQRVKALEYEMKILKNEIQRTLLDIQEQILVHYYPSLRTEEAGPSESATQSVESIREEKQHLEGAPNPPAVRQVSLEHVRTVQEVASISPEGEASARGGQGLPGHAKAGQK